MDQSGSGTEQMDLTRKLEADLFVSSLILESSFGGRRIRRMLEHQVVGTLREIYSFNPFDIPESGGDFASEEEWRNMRACLQDPERRRSAQEKAKLCVKCGISSVNRDDSEYPALLSRLDGMPLILYWKGDLSLVGYSRPPAVAVVGSRQPTHYGIAVTHEITAELSRYGVCVISGLARGIDTAAHETTLRCGGKTVSVLACGLDQVYPPENRELFERISREGLVISEMPPGQRALRQYFPARNRILSGLSDAVAIMEAGEVSGTLHTASFAAAQGREVFAVPGTIYAQQSRGSLRLIQDGACLLLSAQDILAHLAGVTFFREIDEIRENGEKQRIERLCAENPDLLSNEECMRLILSQLDCGGLTADEIVSESGLPFSRIAPLLSELELMGKVAERGKRYVLTFEGS